MPNRGTSRASGFLNPAADLSFSGAIVAQPQIQAASLGGQLAPKTGTIGPSSNAVISNAGPFQPDQTNQTNTTTDTNLANQAAGLIAGLLSNPTQQQQPTAASSLSAAADTLAKPDCDLSQSDLFCVYEVRDGDTLSGIAQRYGLKIGDDSDLTPWQLLVLSNRPDIVSEDDILQPGQHLRIPLHNGVIHTVLSAQTLTDISDLYDVSVADILSVNHLSDANSIGIGSEILIPNPQRYAPPVVADTTSSNAAGGVSSGGGDTSGGGSSSAIVGGGPKSNVGFIWPVTGPISSYFGPAHPLGIDIDLFNHRHAAIAAIAGGVVTFAGGNACCSYGYYVVIDHGNGYQSLYAHLSSISVSVGQVIAQGQQVGISGVTGYSTGEHLHFEIHKNGAVVNPLNYLP
jgi:murein DD-endopeptidase MepM/ murein hydrolase activator NlpD